MALAPYMGELDNPGRRRTIGLRLFRFYSDVRSLTDCIELGGSAYLVRPLAIIEFTLVFAGTQDVSSGIATGGSAASCYF